MAGAVIVVHGGAGNPAGGRIEDEGPYRAALEEALRVGAAALTAEGGAVAAAQAAVARLEDVPIFNAGRGSVLTADGAVEMDAAIADGATRRAGACAAVRTVRHPIGLARAIMERSPHLLLVGDGAERFAAEMELERVDPAWLVTDRERERSEKGTVGAVVLDSDGALAAATSTGGMRGQAAGRVGDSPLIGAGTWADDVCAVSATGDGEEIIRAGAAHEVSALMRHAGLGLAEACERVLGDGIAALGGEAGLIAVAADGSIALPFNTQVMHRGWLRAGGEPETAIGRPG